MREVWAIFADDLASAAPLEIIGNGRAELDRLDVIWAARKWGGRLLHALWLIDADSQRGDVIRIYGSVPAEIARRYEAFLERTGDTGL